MVQICWAKRWDWGIRIRHVYMGMAMLLCAENLHLTHTFIISTYRYRMPYVFVWDDHVPLQMTHHQETLRLSLLCLARFGEGMGTDLSIARLQTKQQWRGCIGSCFQV